MKIDDSGGIEQHSTWIAANPVVGCPKGCEYCFLRPSKLTQIKPMERKIPEISIEELLGSNLYHPDIPVAIGTFTDMFATPANIEYLKEFILRWNQKSIPNTLVMITKCKVPDDVIALMQQCQTAGSSFVIFLSYSGLDNTIEKGVNHKELKGNFARLKLAGIPVIHYWRPFTPLNSSEEIMMPVLDTAIGHASSSMIAGLKMTRAMVEQFGFWPELQKLDVDPSDYESVYTQEALDNIKLLMEAHPDHPMYFATSCAISRAFKRPEFNGVWGTQVCSKSSCPIDQREICNQFHKHRIINPSEIDDALKKLGIKFNYAVTTSDEGVNRLIIDGELDITGVFNLSQRLKMIVEAKQVGSDGYEWGSQIIKKTLIINPNNNEQ